MKTTCPWRLEVFRLVAMDTFNQSKTGSLMNFQKKKTFRLILCGSKSFWSLGNFLIHLIKLDVNNSSKSSRKFNSIPNPTLPLIQSGNHTSTKKEQYHHFKCVDSRTKSFNCYFQSSVRLWFNLKLLHKFSLCSQLL